MCVGHFVRISDFSKAAQCISNRFIPRAASKSIQSTRHNIDLPLRARSSGKQNAGDLPPCSRSFHWLCQDGWQGIEVARSSTDSKQSRFCLSDERTGGAMYLASR
jgi:hypothetical protein